MLRQWRTTMQEPITIYEPSPAEQLFRPPFPKSGGDGCSTCDLHEYERALKSSLQVRGWGSVRTSPDERGRTAHSSLLSKCGGDGCPTCDLHEGAGTTLVAQLRPASCWRCRCSKFRSGEARNGTSFGIEQMSNIVWSRRSAGADRATVSAARTLVLPFPHALCKDYLHDSTDQHHPPLQPREIAYATES